VLLELGEGEREGGKEGRRKGGREDDLTPKDISP
jgi:hypothetical protein